MRSQRALTANEASAMVVLWIERLLFDLESCIRNVGGTTGEWNNPIPRPCL